MLRNSKQGSRFLLFGFAAVALAIVTVTSGCGGSTTEKISSNTSGLKPDDGGAENGGDKPADQTALPPGHSINDGHDHSGDAHAGHNHAAPAGAGTNGSAGGNGAISKPPVNPGNLAENYTVPDGTPEELMAFVDAMGNRSAIGTTMEEKEADARLFLSARVDATDKIIAADASPEITALAVETKIESLMVLSQINTPGAKEELEQFLRARVATAEKVLTSGAAEDVTVQAVTDKVDSLRVLAQLESAGAEQELDKFAKLIRNDKNPEIAEQGKFVLLQLQVEKVTLGQPADPQPALNAILAEIEALVNETNAGMSIFEQATTAAIALYQSQHTDTAFTALNLIGNRFKQNADEELVMQAYGLLDQVKMLELGYSQKVMAAQYNEPDSIPALIESTKTLLTSSDLGPLVLGEVSQGAHMVEVLGNPKDAEELFDLLKTAYANHPLKDLAEQADLIVVAAENRARLPGSTLDITGELLDGSKFDFSEYRGKVVLVDFWATWCGPCLAALPVVRQTYERYRDRGFEVVGVNVDDDREAVNRFFATQQLPWKTVVSDDPDAQGMENPVAVHCGVQMIPFMVLIGQDGKVVATNLSAREVAGRLEGLLGPAGDAAIKPVGANVAPGNSNVRNP